MGTQGTRYPRCQPVPQPRGTPTPNPAGLPQPVPLPNCTSASTPMVAKPHLLDPTPHALPRIADNDIKPLFQKLVGSLIYLAICTCPDISYAAMALGQFNANPSHSHLVAAKHVLRYIAGTVDLALEFNFDGDVIPATIGGFIWNCVISDADWASDESDHKSISGYCFYFMNSLISWSTVKQKTISLSSTEAEYYSITHAVKEALWIRLFLTLHSFPFLHLFPLLSDNQSACALRSLSEQFVHHLLFKTYRCSPPFHLCSHL